MVKPTARGIFSGLLDKFIGWRLSLPPELCSYTVHRKHIDLEDGVKIAADLYLPANFKPLGTIFVPSPYGIGLPGSLTQARVFAARGYQVLTSCCRGTFDSGGEFSPGRNEASDGHAIVAWIRGQSWYTGSFATLGGSYLGYNQWALLTDPPQDMKAAVIWTGPHDFGDFIWGAGALSSNMIAWADLQKRMRRGDGLISIIRHLRSQPSVLKPVYDSLPLLDAVDQFFHGDTPPWLREVMNNSDLTDGYWKPLDQSAGIEKANIPILLTAGWDDLILSMVIQQYEILSHRGCNVALTIGPWTHLGAQAQNTLSESFNWLEEHLGKRKARDRTSPIRIFVTGAQEWRDLPEWPPQSSSLEMYLNTRKRLSAEKPSAKSPASTFDFDPANPTPSIGTPLLFDNGPGRNENNNPLAMRSDVLVFETNPLEEDVEVCGKPSLTVYHSTKTLNADLFVLLSEVNAKGDFSRSISEKYLRLPVEENVDSRTLVLTDCAHRFCKGTRIRLLLAGGCHPRYIRNLGTGEDPVRGTEMQVVQHTVRHDKAAPSRLILPVSSSQ